MKSILDPSFVYTPSTQTDLKTKFSRIRRLQRQQEREKQQAQQPDTNVFNLKKYLASK